MENEIRLNIYIKKEDVDREINLVRYHYILGDGCELYINNNKSDKINGIKFKKEGEYKIKIKLKKIIKDCQELFSENDYIINVDLTSFNTRNVTTMEKMFYKCKNLKSVNLSNLNAENLKDISEMFYGCNNLTNVNLSSFNIINVTDMKYMFSHSGLKKINLNFINTHNLKNIAGLFSYCENLEFVDFSSFNTKNVTNMSELFEGCLKLSNIDLSYLNTEKTKNMKSFFAKTNIKDINLSLLDVKNVENMEYFFAESSNIIINEKNFLNSKNCINMDYMFFKCDLKNVNFSYIDTRNAESMESFLAECSNIVINEKNFLNSKNCLNMENFFGKCDLSNVNFKYLDTRNVEKVDYFFSESTNININNDSPLNLKNCTNLNNLFFKCDLSNVNFSFLNIRNVEKITNLFIDCKNITIKDKYIFNSKNCNYMERIFSNCDLKNVNFSFLYTKNVRDIKYFFKDCTNITINKNSFLNLKKCINIENMFYKCDLVDVNFSYMNLKNVINMNYFFNSCKNIKINDKSFMNLNNCVKMDYMFNESDLNNVDFSFLKTENITSMEGFFKYSKNINITNLNTNKVKNMEYFFQGCDLANINISLLNTTNVTDMKGFFRSAKNINNSHLSNLNTKSVINMSFMFSSCFL